MAVDGRVNVPLLPDELFSIMCQHLGQDRDFGTLYNCALSAKSLADPALRTMYQYVSIPPCCPVSHV